MGKVDTLRDKKLLWRPSAQDAEWQLQFPDTSKVLSGQYIATGKTVTVRPGLEVVLPCPQVVTDLVGSNYMKRLRSPADRTDLVVAGLGQIVRDMSGGAAPITADGYPAAGEY